MASNGKPIVDIGRIIDDGKWSAYQKAALVIAALAVILDGFDNQILSLAIPVLIKAWGVTRGDFQYVLTAGFAGMALGTALFGTVGDRVGRRPTLICCVLLFALATIAISFVKGIPMLYPLRFLGGLGLGGAMPNAAALLAELTPSRRRSLGVTLGIIGIPIGGTVGSLVAAKVLPTAGWEALFLIGGLLPLVIAVIMFFVLPESPRFLSRRAERRADLSKLLGRMGHTVDADAEFIDTGERKPEKVSVGAVLSPYYLRDTLGLWGAMFFSLLSVYGVVNYLPAMLGEAGYPPAMTSTGLMYFNLGGVLFALIGALAFGKFGSRTALLVMAAGAALASVGLGLVPLDPSVPSTNLLIMLTLQGGFLNGVQTTMYALGAYIYATEVRGTGVGWAVGLGRLGSILSPLIGNSIIEAFGTRGFFFAIGCTIALAFVSLTLIRRHVPRTGAVEAAPAV